MVLIRRGKEKKGGGLASLPAECKEKEGKDLSPGLLLNIKETRKGGGRGGEGRGSA